MTASYDQHTFCMFDLAELQFGYSTDYVVPAIFSSSSKAGVSNSAHFFLGGGQWTTIIIVGWSTGHTCKNHNMWYTYPPKLLGKLYILHIYITYKCGHRLHNTTWQAAGWPPAFWSYWVNIWFLSKLYILIHNLLASQNLTYIIFLENIKLRTVAIARQ